MHGARLAFVLSAALTSACTETPTAPATRVAAGPAVVAPAPASGAQGDTNARDLHVVVHLPGADPSRWLIADYSGCAMPVTLSGCVVSAPTEACGANALRISLTNGESALLDASIASLRAPGRCDARPVSDREYRVQGHPGGATGHLPPGPTPWLEGIGECGVPWAVSHAIARLAPH